MYEKFVQVKEILGRLNQRVRSPGGVLTYMGHIGMCSCEGYGFQAVYSSIGYKSERLGLE